MASVKVKFRPSTIEGKEGTIYYQIIQNRVIRQLKTDYRIFTDEWNSDMECLILSTVNMTRYEYLSLIQQNIEWDNRRLQHIIQRLSSSNLQFNADTVVKEFQNKSSEITLFNRMQNTISKLWKQGQYRNHTIFRHDNFIGCFSADKIKMSARKYFCFNIRVYKSMAEESSCRSPYHEEYIQTSASGNPEGLCH